MDGVIDFHTHAFPAAIAGRALTQLRANCHTRTFTDGTQEGLSASMREAGIALSVVQPVATNPRQVVKVNDASIRINECTDETGLLSFGCMHPNYEDWHRELSRLRGAGIRGIKLHPVYQGVDIDDPRCLRLLGRAAELGLIVLIHAGWDVGCPGKDHAAPRMVAHALREVGPMTLVLAHMGGWRSWDEALDLLSGAGVWLDTSFSLGRMVPVEDGYYRSEAELRLMTEERFAAQVRAFGADRVLFGTDSPWEEQAAALDKFRRLPLTAGEQSMILSENAKSLLGIA